MVKDLHNNLFGLPAITALCLIKRVDATTKTSAIQEQYPRVFKGLGALDDGKEMCPDRKGGDGSDLGMRKVH